MDPLISKIIVGDFPELKARYYEDVDDSSPELVESELEYRYADKDLISNLDQLKARFKPYTRGREFERARDRANPYERIDKGRLHNRAPLKLANIDYSLELLGPWTRAKKTSDRMLNFVDIAAGPGGFTQYIQSRFPQNQGYGMTLRDKRLDWNPEIINLKQFETYYGPGEMGDLLVEWENFEKFVKSRNEKIDLVMADGAFELDQEARVNNQEEVNLELFAKECFMTTLSKGHALVKLFGAETNVSASIIFCLSKMFSQIALFKPCTSRPANAERYIVCKNRRSGTESWEKDLRKICHSFGGKLLSYDELPIKFEEYLTLINDVHNKSQTFYCEKIHHLLEGGELIDAEFVNESIAQILLALPEGKWGPRLF